MSEDPVPPGAKGREVGAVPAAPAALHRRLPARAGRLTAADLQRSIDFMMALGEVLGSLTDPVEVESQVCRLLAEHLGAEGAFYVDIPTEEDWIQIVREVRLKGQGSRVGRYPATALPWSLRALRSGRCSIVDDLGMLSQGRSWPDVDTRGPSVSGFARGGACISAPLVRGGRWVGALCVTHAQPHRWSAGEVALVQGVAERLWDVMMRTRAEAALRARTDTLERHAAQLRRLASELTLAEHNTRQVLSRVLHDGLQQQLFCALLTLNGGMQASGGHELLDRAHSELREALELTRSLSIDLFPPVLHNDGLPEALEWLVSWARKNYGITVHVKSDPAADPAAADTRILLFESVRELIFNAAKHAKVSELRVELILLASDTIQIRVGDRGVGFDPQQALGSSGAEPGLGLFSIRERLALLGGEMLVDSAIGSGARFTLRVPRQSSAGDGRRR